MATIWLDDEEVTLESLGMTEQDLEDMKARISSMTELPTDFIWIGPNDLEGRLTDKFYTKS